ncbi:MAG: HK97 family phage prohead protease [Carboxydocellales bacterium]
MAETVKIEHRAVRGFEIRVADDGKRYIEGYAMKWDELSVPLGYYYKFREKFQSGAFDDYFNAGMDTKFLVDHDTGKVLGRSNKGTLSLTTDSTGLKYSLEIPATTLGNDAYEDVRSGNKEYISVGFKAITDEWNEADENNVIRTVLKANLPEISLTAWPAYEQTTASTRSAEDAYKEYKELRAGDKKSDEIRQNQKWFGEIRKKLLQEV